MKELTSEEFARLKAEQLEILSMVEDEIAKVRAWTEDFRKLLEKDSVTQQEVMDWSAKNDIDSELEHLTLSR